MIVYPMASDFGACSELELSSAPWTTRIHNTKKVPWECWALSDMSAFFIVVTMSVTAPVHGPCPVDMQLLHEPHVEQMPLQKDSIESFLVQGNLSRRKLPSETKIASKAGTTCTGSTPHHQ